MSAWSWVARGLGYAGALIPGAGAFTIPAGEAVAQGISAKEATDKQNEQLQAGNQQAMDVYSKTLQPAVDRGNAAGSTLAMMMGLPGGGGQSSGAEGAPALPIPPSAPRPEASILANNAPMQQKGTLASLGIGPNTSSYRTVKMRSPDGTEEQDVPENFVERLKAEGATVVGVA